MKPPTQKRTGLGPGSAETVQIIINGTLQVVVLHNIGRNAWRVDIFKVRPQEWGAFLKMTREEDGI
jgi:hypothetical protein